jgi:hypothetical protein
LKEIADALAATEGALYALPTQTGNAGKFLTTDGTTDSWASIPLDELKVSSVMNVY